MMTKGRGAVLVVVLLVGGLGYEAKTRYEKKERARLSETLFAPLVKKLSDRAVFGTQVRGGWEATVDVGLLFVDAVREEQEWAAFIARASTPSIDSVQPSLAAPLLKFIRTFEAVHAAQRTPEAQQATWRLAQALLKSPASFVKVTTEGGLHLDVDRPAAANVVHAIMELPENKVISELSGREDTLYRGLSDLAVGVAEVLTAWDKAATDRDVAVAALCEARWDVARDAARVALKSDPDDDTVALVAAVAITESAAPDAVLGATREALALLDAIDQRLPAHSLITNTVRAAVEHRRGSSDKARELLEAIVSRMRSSDPLLPPGAAARRFRAESIRPVQETAEAARRADAIWHGAGPLSPALQLARLPVETDQTGAVRRGVVEHFQDRLAHRQIALVPVDIAFARATLAADLQVAFPEEASLELVASPSADGKRVAVAVRNFGFRESDQASLVIVDRAGLAILAAPHPALAQRGETSFGELDLDAPGRVAAGLVIAVQFVAWILPPEGRETAVLASAARIRDDAEARTRLGRALGAADGSVLDELKSSATLETTTGGLRLALPGAVAFLRPGISLHVDGKPCSVLAQALEDDRWLVDLLVGNAPSVKGAPAAELVLSGAITAWKLTWTRRGAEWRADHFDETPER